MGRVSDNLMWIYKAILFSTCLSTSQQITVLSINKQVQRLYEKQIECETTLNNTETPDEGLFCPGTWDNVMCWNDTPAGVQAIQPCPTYINGFDQAEFATKICMEDGTWFTINSSGKPWTNYTTCNKGTILPIDPLIQEHMPRVKLMYTIGYSVSLTFLILAVTIMIYFKRLHCPRNMIHLNLFVAVLIRAAISLMKGALLVNEVGFPVDVHVTESGKTIFVDPGGPHWECRLFFTLFNYSIMATLFWIFNEGLYLQLILSIAVFADKTKIRWFVLLGWGTPILFIIPWIVVRIYYDNTMCWNVYLKDRNLLWIIRGPMILSVFINFIFFMNIIRLLFTKLAASTAHESRRYRYRRLAKSTLILIPLFAVYYMGLIWLPPDLGSTGNVIRLYIELVFNSFQGFFISMLFCFLNTEVQNEIRKKWQRRNLRRASSAAFRSFNSVHQRGSKHHDFTRSIDSSIDCNRAIVHHNGLLASISEEKIPLRSKQDCNDNKTGSALRNGDSCAQNDSLPHRKV